MDDPRNGLQPDGSFVIDVGHDRPLYTPEELAEFEKEQREAKRRVPERKRPEAKRPPNR